MQALLFCATCSIPLAFKVPELTDGRWHAHCPACGNATALEANPSAPGELTTFNAAGVHPIPQEL